MSSFIAATSLTTKTWSSFVFVLLVNISEFREENNDPFYYPSFSKGYGIELNINASKLHVHPIQNDNRMCICRIELKPNVSCQNLSCGGKRVFRRV